MTLFSFKAVNLLARHFVAMNLNVLVTLTANNIHPEGRVVVPGLNMEPQKPVDGHV